MRVNARLTEPDHQRSALLDSLADGYYEADLEGNLLVTNRSLWKLVGCDNPAVLAGDAYSRFFDAANVQRLVQAARNVLKTGEPIPILRLPIRRLDGEMRLFEASIALLKNDAGQPRGFHGTVRDITQSERRAGARQYEAPSSELLELRKRYAELSELEQLKTHIIRVTAHDIRSPLSIIASYIELLDEDLAQYYGDLDSMYVNAVKQAVGRIMQLTSDVLTLERLNAYRDVTLTRVNLGGLLQRTVNEFSDNVRQRNQQVTVNAEPLSVSGDGVELHEALANLIGNASKYTPEGGSIEARLERDGDSALLEIIDSGYGIPEAQQGQLFQLFQRIKTAETHAIDGTGLGLYLVKKIVERHGGTVHFESHYGKGSTFGFRLPLPKTSE